MAFVLSAGERNERTALPELISQSAVKRSGQGRPNCGLGPWLAIEAIPVSRPETISSIAA